ncbi:MAG: TRAM domain-containing protein, partial [Methanobrevibacter sp.]|nr:TRAM domain-containing protein [Candidatus Methanoflexus mossambicus]
LSKYKHREGAISSLLDEIPHEIMKKRSKELTQIKNKITEEENKELIGTIQKTLIVEKGSKGGFIGKSDNYLPIVVDNAKIGTFVDVKITEATSTYLKGIKIE